MSDEFGISSQNFLQEFLAQPGASFHSSLDISDLRRQGRGRGILALSKIPADTELFTIPRSYVISVSQSPLFKNHPEIFDKLAQSGVTSDDVLPRPWLELILVLIHDHLHLSTSKWKAYWNVLPSRFDTLMFWTDQELQELQASSARKRIGKAKADKLFRKQIIPLIREHKADFFRSSDGAELSDSDLLELCHRMGSLIMAYAFDLDVRQSESASESEEEGDGWTEDSETDVAMGMVPMADTLNADAEFNAHVEHESDRLVVRSLRDIEAGEEVLNYYGPLGNSELARRYGYTSDLHSRFDVVELSQNLVLQTIKEELEGDVSRAYKEVDELEEAFILERDADGPDDTGRHHGAAELTKFPDELVNQVTAFVAAALGLELDTARLNDRDTTALKLAFLRVLDRVVGSRLAGYPTTLEEDERMSSGKVATRLKMALDIRKGEKKLLLEAKQLAIRFRAKYEQGAASKKRSLQQGIEGKQAKKKAK